MRALSAPGENAAPSRQEPRRQEVTSPTAAATNGVSNNGSGSGSSSGGGCRTANGSGSSPSGGLFGKLSESPPREAPSAEVRAFIDQKSPWRKELRDMESSPVAQQRVVELRKRLSAPGVLSPCSAALLEPRFLQCCLRAKKYKVEKATALVLRYQDFRYGTSCACAGVKRGTPLICASCRAPGESGDGARAQSPSRSCRRSWRPATTRCCRGPTVTGTW